MNPKPLLRKATHLINNAADCLSEALEVLAQTPTPETESAEALALVAACAQLDAVYRSNMRFASNKETL